MAPLVMAADLMKERRLVFFFIFRGAVDPSTYADGTDSWLLADAPFPHAVEDLVIQTMTRLFEQQHDLAAMMRFVRNHVSGKGDGMGLETLYPAIRLETIVQETSNRPTGFNQRFAK